MADWIVVKAKTKAGHIQDFQVAEILEIDGKPYRPVDEIEAFKNHIIHLDGRVTALEAIVSGKTA